MLELLLTARLVRSRMSAINGAKSVPMFTGLLSVHWHEKRIKYQDRFLIPLFTQHNHHQDKRKRKVPTLPSMRHD